MKSVLLTNDDGYLSAGFFPLLDELTKSFAVTAIAPKSQRSSTGKSLSTSVDIAFEKLMHESQEIYAIDGTPADCVQIGLYGIMDKRPDFVVSGINNGANTGHGRILSSGTIGAAMEGAIDGVMGVAVSLCTPEGLPPNAKKIDYYSPDSYHYYQAGAAITARILAALKSTHFGVDIDVISINIPFNVADNAPIEITLPHRAAYGQLFRQNEQTYRSKWTAQPTDNLEPGTDWHAVSEGKVAVAPISLQLATPEAVTFLKDTLLPKL